ncbi:MAG: folate family ECF transporter S component [Anaerovoracaceae bacterium]|jgi:ECF transporter S component (folate family)
MPSYRKELVMTSKSLKNVTTITCIALLIALDIILTRFVSINTQFLRIGFGMIPVALAGAAFGPVWGGVCGAVGDLLGIMIFPSGAFFPGFTLTAALTGIIFGLCMYHRPKKIRYAVIASVIVCIGCNLILDTLWLDIMYGSGFLAILPARAVKCAVNIPIYSFLVYVLWDKAIARIPYFRTI